MTNQVISPSTGENDSESLWLGYVIIAIAVICLGAGGYLLYTQFKTPVAPAAPAPADNGSGSSGNNMSSAKSSATTTSTYVAPVISAFPLHDGSVGDEVKNFQQYLNTTYNAGLTEDGIWGSKTTAAASKYIKTTSVSQAEYDNMLATSASTPVSPIAAGISDSNVQNLLSSI